MSNENVEEFSGIIEDIQPQFDKNKKLFFKFKINGLTYNWFTANDKPGEETAKSLNKGDGVKGLVELNDGEYNGKPITYRNIKEMHKEQLPQQAVQESEPQPKENQTEVEKMDDKVSDFKAKEADKFELGMAKNNAMVWMGAFSKGTGSPVEILKRQYWEIVDYLYESGKEHRKKKLGY